MLARKLCSLANSNELTAGYETQTRGKSFLGILLSILVLLLISSVIVVAIVIINPEITSLPRRQPATRAAITLEDSILGELAPKNFAFDWLTSSAAAAATAAAGHQPDDQLAFEQQKTIQLATVNSTAGLQLTTIVSNSSLLGSFDYQGFRLSPSRRFLLIWTAKKRQFRHSFTARYYIYDLQLDLISLLATGGPASDQPPAPTFNTFETLDAASLYLADGQPSGQLERPEARFQLADWFARPSQRQPPAQQIDSLLLVQGNDLYLVRDVAQLGSAPEHSPVRLTHSGRPGDFFNGVPDWLYEEEILGHTPAHLISPDANRLAYMTFDDSNVETMPITVYGDQLIPQIQRIKYPKTGQPNPLVRVNVIENLLDSAGGRSQPVAVDLPDELSQQQHYIHRLAWLTNEHLALIWTNRNQNVSQILVCSSVARWRCVKNLEFSSPSGWLDIGDDFQPATFSSSSAADEQKHYLMLMPKFEGPEVGYFKHLARVSLEGTQKYQFITGGRREIISIDALDHANSLVYYTATVVDEPGQRQVYATHLDDRAMGRSEWCLTCSHYPDECLYNYAKFSPSSRHYVFECDGPGVPKVELRSTGWLVAAANGNRHKSTSDEAKAQQPLWLIEDNRELRERLETEKAMPLTMRLKIPIANTSHLANVLLLLPPQLGASTTFKMAAATPGVKVNAGEKLVPLSSGNARSRRDATTLLEEPQKAPNDVHFYYTPETIRHYVELLGSGQQYPMVVDVYAGPGSQRVDYRWHLYFGHYFASSMRTVYAMIDGRGSGFQGSKRLHELYHRLGTVEIQDQIEVTSQLVRQLNFIDPTKVAIWGWSYGGYAAAMALARSNANSLRTSAQLDTAANHVNTTVAPAAATTTTTPSQPNPHNSGSPSASGQSRVEPAAGSAGVFECAASVAPVTDWIFYDTAYTERFMSSPFSNEHYDHLKLGDHSSNTDSRLRLGPIKQTGARPHSDLGNTSNSHLLSPNSSNSSRNLASASNRLNQLKNNNIHHLYDLNERYRQASLLEQIANIDRKRFLLIHGTSDDNVHFQQSIVLMRKLIQKNVLFETRLYPDQDHSIANKADKLHLGSTLTNFFAECFDMAHPHH